MKVLILTNIFPNSRKPDSGTYVANQVNSLPSFVKTSVVFKTQKSTLGLLPFHFNAMCNVVLADYDLIHAHYGFHSAFVPTLFKRKPLIVTFHGSDALIEPNRNALYRLLQRRVVSHSSRIIAVSNQIRNYLVNELGASISKIEIIPCGVDTDKFRARPKHDIRDRLNIKRDMRMVIFIGRLTHAKGVHYLREASRELSNVDFYFLGNGPLRWNAPNCHFLSVLDHDRVPEWINAADILVLPSHSEGTPAVVLEALASETPVICSAVGACPELILNGKTGLLIPTGSVHALTYAIKLAVFEIDFKTHLGRKKMKEVYDLRLISNKLVTLYSNILKQAI